MLPFWGNSFINLIVEVLKFKVILGIVELGGDMISFDGQAKENILKSCVLLT